MKFRLSCFSVVILSVTIIAVPLRAREKTDVIIMKNGDRMTCEIKGLEGDVLYVEFDYIDGTAAVNWSKVARLESKYLFVLTTQDGTVYRGKLGTAEAGTGRPLKIEVIETPEEKLPLKSSEVVRMIPTSDRFRERFNGGINLGLIYSKGNQSTQYSLGSTTEYTRERWNAHANYDSNLSSSTGENISTRNYLDLGARHLLPWKRWFYSGLADFLQSSVQGIELQTTLGGGIGRYLTNSEHHSIAVFGGAAWQNTTYKQANLSPNGQNITTSLFWAQAKLFKFSKSDLEATGTLLPALSDPGRLRFNTNASYYIKLVSDLKWHVSFYGNWDNQPPPGFSKSDYGTSTGITWSFGLK